MTNAAAIYCRISKDTAHEGLGVQRQADDCKAFAERRGWKVSDVLIENDTSAYGKKKRPVYESMLAGIEDGTYDSVIVWHPDRLHRHPAELEHFIDVIEATHIPVGTVTAGDWDLATPDGRLMARIVGSVARKESEDKSRRLRRKHLELADNGKISGGGRRPFGYESDRRTIRESEAVEIRKAAARVLAGESIRGIVYDWRDRGVRTVTGAEWSPTTVRRLLKSGRISGQREHHGVIVGAAEWPGIIDPDDTIKIRAILNDPARTKGGGAVARSYLLTGFLVCGRCGATMSTQPVIRKGHKYRRYVCAKDRGGCGRCGIGAEPLEDLVSEFVFVALDGPALRKAVAKVAKANAKGSAGSVGNVAILEHRMAELAELFADGDISKAEWKTARDSIDRQLDAARQAVVSATADTSTSGLAGRGDALRSTWPSMSLDERRAVVGAVIETVAIAGTTRADNKFNPDRVSVGWRF